MGAVVRLKWRDDNNLGWTRPEAAFSVSLSASFRVAWLCWFPAFFSGAQTMASYWNGEDKSISKMRKSGFRIIANSYSLALEN